MTPIWHSKPATAELVKQQVHEVLKWAVGEGHRTDNPIGPAGVKATAHGFRSSFRNWAGELSGASHEAMERALAHTIKNRTEAAYNRTDLLEQRRGLMEAWAHYLGDQRGKVVKLAARR